MDDAQQMKDQFVTFGMEMNNLLDEIHGPMEMALARVEVEAKEADRG